MVVLTVIALVFAVAVGGAWARRREEEPLRKEIEARPVVTFWASVDVNADTSGTMTPQRGPMDLTVRGDVFEISHWFPPARLAFGQDYCYRAADTTIRILPGWRHDWIEIAGRPGAQAVRIQVGRRKMNQQIWDALILAGARPTGGPPAGNPGAVTGSPLPEQAGAPRIKRSLTSALGRLWDSFLSG